jgi:hypothetical protein
MASNKDEVQVLIVVYEVQTVVYWKLQVDPPVFVTCRTATFDPPSAPPGDVTSNQKKTKQNKTWRWSNGHIKPQGAWGETSELTEIWKIEN